MIGTKEEVVLGIDLGTSYFKFCLFDRQGRARGLARMAVEKETDDQGKCELPVDRFWATLRAGVSQAVAESGLPVEAVRGVGYSSQANSFLLVDADGNELTPIILWPDQRGTMGPRSSKRLFSRPRLPVSDAVQLAGDVPPLSVAKLPDPDSTSRLSDPKAHATNLRSIMESVAASACRLAMRLFPEQKPERIVATGGGARSDLWLQLIADIGGLPVCRAACTEPASRGAATVASLQAGWFSNLERCAETWREAPTSFEPDASRHEVYSEWLAHRDQS